jgi:hypothetical protein
VLALAAGGLFMQFVDLPTSGTPSRPGMNVLAWVFNAYTIVFGAFLVVPRTRIVAASA